MPLVTPSPGLGARLAQMRLPDSEKKLAAFQSLWAERTLILVHLNGFGSLVCLEQVQQLLDAMPDLREVGLELAVVGAGDPTAALGFKAKFPRKFPVMIDADLRSFEVIGEGHRKSAKRNSTSALMRQVKLLRNTAPEAKTGAQAAHVLGATHIVRPGGEVIFGWLNDLESGVCPLEQVLAALEEDSIGLQASDEDLPEE